MGIFGCGLREGGLVMFGGFVMKGIINFSYNVL